MGDIMRVGIVVLVVIVAAVMVFIMLNAQTAKQKAPTVITKSSSVKEKSDTKLGWMDNALYTERDRQRVIYVSDQMDDSNLSVIRSIQSGIRGSVTRRDFELMRQDRRRAQAAYPDVSRDDLFTGGWVNVDLSARIPRDFCTSGNSNSTQGKDGKWYLDGGCYTSFVRSQYTKRADAETTVKYFAAMKTKQREEKLARLRKEGPFAWMAGSGGLISVRFDKKTNEVVVIRAKEWASKATEYRIPFVLEEWVDVDAYDIDAIKKVPSFAKATEHEIDVQSTGVTMSSGSMGSPVGTLMPGESTTVTMH